MFGTKLENVFTRLALTMVLYRYKKPNATAEDKPYSGGVPWNGLTAVTESPSGAEASPLYADNIKYLNLMSPEEFGATIEAYIYPDEFAVCDGSAEIAPGVMIGQQKREVFGMCYRTKIGNDTEGADHGYKLHLIYGCLAAPSEKGYNTINDSPDAITFVGSQYNPGQRRGLRTYCILDH